MILGSLLGCRIVYYGCSIFSEEILEFQCTYELEDMQLEYFSWYKIEDMVVWGVCMVYDV